MPFARGHPSPISLRHNRRAPSGTATALFSPQVCPYAHGMRNSDPPSGLPASSCGGDAYVRCSLGEPHQRTTQPQRSQSGLAVHVGTMWPNRATTAPSPPFFQCPRPRQAGVAPTSDNERHLLSSSPPRALTGGTACRRQHERAALLTTPSLSVVVVATRWRTTAARCCQKGVEGGGGKGDAGPVRRSSA